MAATTRTDAIRSAALKGLLAAACFGVGIYAIYFALQMVSIFGEGMGVDERSRALYSNVHIIVHVFGALSAILISVFFDAGRKALGGLAIGAMLLCGGYGILNMVGFTSTNRVSVAEAKKAANASDERRYKAAIDAKKADIEWTRRTIITEEMPREKRRLESALAKKQAELEALQPPKPSAANVISDPQSFVLGFLSGISAETLMFALPVPAAILTYAAEVLSWIFGVQLLFSAVLDWRAMAAPATGTKRGSNNGGGGGNRSHETVKVPSDSKVSEVSVAVKGLSEPMVSVPKPNVVPFKMQHLPSLQLGPGKFSSYTRAEAFDDLQAQLAQRGMISSQAELARRWNKPQPTVSRWLSKWERHVQRVKVGKINSIRQQRMGDGGARTAIHA